MSTFSNILQEFEVQQRQAKEDAQAASLQREARKKAFIAEFANMTELHYRPLMEQLVSDMAAKDYSAKVDDYLSNEVPELCVRLAAQASFTLRLNPSEQTVAIVITTRGEHNKPVATFKELRLLTQEALERHLGDWLRAALGMKSR